MSTASSGGEDRQVPVTPSVPLVVHVYCGNFIGPPKWQGLDYYEPDECHWEGDVEFVEIEGEPWRQYERFLCPGCGAINMVTDHEVTDA